MRHKIAQGAPLIEGRSGVLRPRGNNYPPPTFGYGKNLPSQTHLTLQLWPHPPKRLISTRGLHAERVAGRDPHVLADLTRVNMALSGIAII